jgi:hypothetical protein
VGVLPAPRDQAGDGAATRGVGVHAAGAERPRSGLPPRAARGRARHVRGARVGRARRGLPRARLEAQGFQVRGLSACDSPSREAACLYCYFVSGWPSGDETDSNTLVCDSGNYDVFRVPCAIIYTLSTRTEYALCVPLLKLRWLCLRCMLRLKC